MTFVDSFLACLLTSWLPRARFNRLGHIGQPWSFISPVNKPEPSQAYSLTYHVWPLSHFSEQAEQPWHVAWISKISALWPFADTFDDTHQRVPAPAVATPGRYYHIYNNIIGPHIYNIVGKKPCTWKFQGKLPASCLHVASSQTPNIFIALNIPSKELVSNPILGSALSVIDTNPFNLPNTLMR